MPSFSHSAGAYAHSSNQSYAGNVYSQAGTVDADAFNIYREAQASNGYSAALTGNSVTLGGGASSDTFFLHLRAHAQTGSTATSSGNATTIDGGDGDDGFNGSWWGYSYTLVQAYAYGAGASAASTTNQMSYSGGLGDDYHQHNIDAQAYSGGSALSSGNSAILSGGAGSDHLSGWIGSYTVQTGSTAFSTGNTITIDAGDGQDVYNVGIGSSANQGGSSSSTGNTINVTAGDGDDGYWAPGGYYGSYVQFNASADSGGVSTTADNTITTSLGAGNDLSYHYWSAYSSSSGNSSLSNNSSVIDAGAGTDTLQSVSYAYSLSGGNTTVTGNTHSISGGDGSDYINGQAYIYAGYYWDSTTPGGTVTWSDNSIAIDTGADGGQGTNHLHVVASEGGSATVSGNVRAFTGGDGNDYFGSGYSTTNGYNYYGTDGGTVTISGNSDSATGGLGSDNFNHHLNGHSELGGSTTVTGNSYSATGGDGTDSFYVTLSRYSDGTGTATVANNSLSLDGGNDADHLQAYLYDGTTNNVVTMTGGAGNDTFQSADYGSNSRLFTGGAGNDTVYDWTGFSTAAYEGTRADYLVQDLGSGWVRVTDLRPGAPDGIDQLYHVDQLRFADGDFAVADLLADTVAPGAPTLDLADASDTGASFTDNVTADTTPTLQGQAEANSTVDVYEGATLLGSTTADGDGNWALTVATPLSEGVHDLNAYATDGSGNTSEASITLTITFDTSILAPTIDLAAGSDSGISDSDDMTNATMPTVSGTAEAGSTVVVYEGATIIGAATADGSGNWTTTVTLTGDGEHVLRAEATDIAGNSASSTNLTVTLDTMIAAPTITWTSPNAYDTMPNLEGTAEAGSSVAINDEDGNLVATVTADSEGIWAYEFETALLDGDYVFSATATDAAGNESITVSADVPVIVMGSTINGGNGNDTLYGTNGRDTMNGGNGTDTLNGGWAPDQLFGGNGNDVLNGGEGADLLNGENGNDTLNGGDGDDLLDGGRGDDILIGGAGDDFYVVGQSSGNDIVQDFEIGDDTVLFNDGVFAASFATGGGNSTVTLSNGATLTLQGVLISTLDDLVAPPDPTLAFTQQAGQPDLLAF